ncbi:unnamed protein product [Candidula unifasciata]|uniref:Galactosylceramidase n=1 Tax=Candidula unifasciata TaxID=100452 RepID=A0A8S3Z1Y4_9EUPU|nr:unnamed protein product [Candidula unifasciata]
MAAHFWSLAWLLSFLTYAHCDLYQVNDQIGVGRRFDGIGGLSGGSATSKLLIAYPDQQRNEILDYLFKPKFGASLQILKVEIGGDAQASDATEASHMHVEWEENYQRGYEWWLMKEAKKRNPNIQLYGLPWAFPGWLGHGTQNPYYDRQKLANYIYKWIWGAKVYHNLTIDYIGIWNEQNCDLQYIMVLRDILDRNGFMNTKIVATDSWWSAISDIELYAEVTAAVDALGVHYPGVLSPDSAINSGKQLWSSEDYSSFNDEVGGGCWARILNQNYVKGLMTSTIAWNLIDSFYQALPWDRDSLMTAREPVEWQLYSHTTQLSEIGWRYLPHDHGVGMLNQGGSYVTLVSPDLSHLTIVIEAMSHNHSLCIRPKLPWYTVTTQNVTFVLTGSFSKISQLFIWQSTLTFNGTTPTYFKSLGTVPVINGQVTIIIQPDQIISLTTLNDATHGEYLQPPPSAPFPLPFIENFEDYPVSSEPYTMAPQQGSYDVVDVGGEHGKVMRQMVLQTPIAWCSGTLNYNGTLNVVGSFNWTDITISTDILLGGVNASDGAFIGVRINNGGCTTYAAMGLFFFTYPNDGRFSLTSDVLGKNVIVSGRESGVIVPGWNTLTLSVKGTVATGICNGVELFSVLVPSFPANGFAGVGTDIYGYADFDNIQITNAADPSASKKKSKALYFQKESHDVSA